MTVFSRDLIELWPVALLAVVAPAVPVGFHVASPGFTLAQPRLTGPQLAQPRLTEPRLTGPRAAYPIRFELPAARPVASGPAAPALEFDLANEGGSPVELRKPVRLNGADAGSATIRVGADSALAISAGELSMLLARAGRGDLSRQINGLGEGYVGFEELRRLGIDLRYDAAADRIAIAV